MPLRLQVGLQQKVGRPDYGSLGAACQVELELDSQLLIGLRIKCSQYANKR